MKKFIIRSKKILFSLMNFTIAPMMVILLNWTTGIKGLSTINALIITVATMVVYITIIGINSQKEEKIKLVKIYTLKHLKDAFLFFSMVLLTGVLLTYFSNWINSKINNVWTNDVILIIQATVAALLVFTHSNLRSYNPKSSTAKIMFIITVILIATDYYFGNLQMVLFIFLSIYSVYIFYQIINIYTKPYNDIKKDEDFVHKQHLILFLSHIKKKDDFNRWKDLKSTSLIGQIEELENGGFHNWKVTLKGIDAHKKELKKITIISSKSTFDDDGKEIHGSWEQAEEFKRKIKSTYPDNKKPIIEIAHQESKGVDFSSFEDVNAGLIMILESYSDYSYEETIIDFTGGQKSTSVAATLAATSYPVHCQYVDTNTLKVGAYDFKYTDPTKIS